MCQHEAVGNVEYRDPFIMLQEFHTHLLQTLLVLMDSQYVQMSPSQLKPCLAGHISGAICDQ